MTTITSAKRAEIRKAAIRAQAPTAGWTDRDFIQFATDNGISLDEPVTAPVKPRKPRLEPVVDEPVVTDPTPAPLLPAATEPLRTSASVDDAIKALIAATATATAPAGIDEAAVVALIEKHTLAPREVTINLVTDDREPVKIEGQHKDFGTVLAMIAAGVNVVAVGPAGSGKSTIFEKAAETLKLDYYFQGAVQQEHKILGYMDANGAYHSTQFRDAYENGGLFVFEEFDGSHARAMLAINNAVAGSWCDFPDGKVAKHKSFVCVMAGNTFGTGATRQYVGRTQLDAATLDRFAFIEIGYDELLEMRIALAIWNDQQTRSWVAEVQAFRKAVDKAGINHVVSPRASIMGTRMLMGGQVSGEIIRASVLHKSLDADSLAQLGV